MLNLFSLFVTLYLVGWTIVIRCSKVCTTLYCASCKSVRIATARLITGTRYRDHNHAGTTWTPLATHPRACQVQSGMSCSPVAVRAGASLPGRWLLPRVRQHSVGGCHQMICGPVTCLFVATSPVAVSQSLSGMTHLGTARQHITSMWHRSAWCAGELSDSWRSDLRGAANTQQLRRLNFCSRWTPLVELSSGLAA